MKNVKTNSKKKTIPFEFIFDYLMPIEFVIKPMFGMYSVYADEKLLMILRQRNEHPKLNGIWVALSEKESSSLEKELPSLICIDGYEKGDWRLIPVDSEGFEDDARRLCELIVASDSRIGKITMSPEKRSSARKEKY